MLSEFGIITIWRQVYLGLSSSPLYLSLDSSTFLGKSKSVANVNHLSYIDVLRRRIPMKATGLTLRLGLIPGIAYELLENISLISFEPEIRPLLWLMTITYIIIIFNSNSRYK
jgi:hypothetical protein